MTLDNRILHGEEPQDGCLSSADNTLPVGHTMSQLSTPFFLDQKQMKKDKTT